MIANDKNQFQPYRSTIYDLRNFVFLFCFKLVNNNHRTPKATCEAGRLLPVQSLPSQANCIRCILSQPKEDFVIENNLKRLHQIVVTINYEHKSSIKSGDKKSLTPGIYQIINKIYGHRKKLVHLSSEQPHQQPDW